MNDDYQKNAYLDSDPIVHEDDENITFEHQADVEKVIDYNAEIRAQRRGQKLGDGMHHIMRVPTVILEKIRNEYGWDFMNPDHWPYVVRILKHPDYKKFRTYDGKI